MRVVVAGASGGAGSSADLGQPGGGGVGGVAVADLVVTPGRRLYVLVGGIGRTFGSGGDGGFNGGGRGGVGRSGGGGGGGASDLRTCSIADRTCDTLASRLIVAAGGGGGGGGGSLLSAISAGAGGSASADGTGGAGAGPGGGAGATAANGGAGGTGAGAGGLGAGGDGAGGAEAGGGGGGGDHGGGGGAAGTATGSGSGGGAGASFGPRGTKFGRSTAAQGLVRITYVTASTVNRPPAVQITGPRSGASVSRRGLVVSGRASDASGVRAVALRIERLPRTSGRCTWLDPFSGLRRASCDQPPSLSATLRSSGSWTYRVPGAIVLPGGRYRVTAYGADETGIYGNSARSSTRAVTFRLRR